jgi:ferredoxin, 2Fe-2S
MPIITYIQPDEIRREIDVPVGTTLKDGAVMNDVEGILGECGGAAMCATCHVYVDDEWRERVPAIEDAEDMMLESTTAPRTKASRLACQIEATPGLDGLVLRVAESQR